MKAAAAPDPGRGVARLFLWFGIISSVVFTFVTPPFRVPDEVGHFWRAESIAYGTFLPRVEDQGAVAGVPSGVKMAVSVFWFDSPEQEATITSRQFRLMWDLPLGDDHLDDVVLPAGYTPVPYVPQIVAALIGRFTDVRLVFIFYLGRLLNALVFVGIVALAIRATPVAPWVFFTAALLPMSMYLAASWSADALTIASSFYFTAALIRATRFPPKGHNLAALVFAGAVVGACKPAYFLLALLAFFIPAARNSPWLARLAVIAATAAGLAFAILGTASAPSTRRDVFVSQQAQFDCIRHEPMRYLRTLGNEVQRKGGEYAEQAVGRLGLLNVWLPPWVKWSLFAALLMAAFSAESSVPLRVRVAAAAITAATFGGIFTASYLGWTPPCADFIDGIQGRYVLPVLPLLLVAVSVPLLPRVRLTGPIMASVIAVAHVAAVTVLASHYYW